MRIKKLKALGVVAVLMLVVAACGGTSTEATTTTEGATATTEGPTATTAAPTTTAAPGTTMAPSSDMFELEIEAFDSEGFSLDRLRVPAGVEVALTFVNKDIGGEAHNIHVRTPTDNWFTDVKEGPDTQTLVFTIGTPGEYQYFCDTHSETMKGTLIVESG